MPARGIRLRGHGPDRTNPLPNLEQPWFGVCRARQTSTPHPKAFGRDVDVWPCHGMPAAQSVVSLFFSYHSVMIEDSSRQTSLSGIYFEVQERTLNSTEFPCIQKLQSRSHNVMQCLPRKARAILAAQSTKPQNSNALLLLGTTPLSLAKKPLQRAPAVACHGPLDAEGVSSAFFSYHSVMNATHWSIDSNAETTSFMFWGATASFLAR